MGKVPYNKSPTHFTEQIALLKHRGLSVADKDTAEFQLSQLNFTRLTAYFLPFEQTEGNHQFKANTNFDDILNLYTFDRELRLLVLDAIERIEVSLRTQLAYHLSHNHQMSHPHLNPKLFFNPKTYNYCLNTLDACVKRSQEDFIKYLTETYEERLPPIWAVVELMTMGQLSKWFCNIKARTDRQDISRIYDLDEKIMTSLCTHLSHVRNCAAHHARLWNRDFTITPTLPRRGDQALINSLFVLPNNDQRLRKLYNSFVMLIHLTNVICRDNHWKCRLIRLIDNHRIDTRKMGFPEGWEKQSIWC